MHPVDSEVRHGAWPSCLLIVESCILAGSRPQVRLCILAGVSRVVSRPRWLKQIWTCKSYNFELRQSSAVKLAKRFLCTLTDDDAKIVVEVRACCSRLEHIDILLSSPLPFPPFPSLSLPEASPSSPIEIHLRYRGCPTLGRFRPPLPPPL